jgi:hypothetical protein
VSYISAIKAERRSLSCMFLVACLGGKRGEMPKSRLQLAAFNRRTKKAPDYTPRSKILRPNAQKAPLGRIERSNVIHFDDAVICDRGLDYD